MANRPNPAASDDVWEEFCVNNPEDQYCIDNIETHYEYDLALAPNAIFLGIMAACAVAFAVTLGVTRRGTSFNIAMMLGTLVEVLGYAGRVMSYKNPWADVGFLMQICCLTIAPAFLAAGIYLCLRRIVTVFGKENSIWAPEWYTRIFIPCDIVSLILQALGGALASIGSGNKDVDQLDMGNNIMMAGLAFQVFTLVIFIGASGLFAFRAARRHRELGGAAAFDPAFAALRRSLPFHLFLAALTTATLTIFGRCVFRVAELSGGWDGPLMARQDLFIGLEGVMISVACVALVVFNPSFCFKQGMEAGQGGLACCFGRKKKAQQAAAAEKMTTDESDCA